MNPNRNRGKLGHTGRVSSPSPLVVPVVTQEFGNGYISHDGDGKTLEVMTST